MISLHCLVDISMSGMEDNTGCVLSIDDYSTWLNISLVFLITAAVKIGTSIVSISGHDLIFVAFGTVDILPEYAAGRRLLSWWDNKLLPEYTEQ